MILFINNLLTVRFDPKDIETVDPIKNALINYVPIEVKIVFAIVILTILIRRDVKKRIEKKSVKRSVING